MIIWVDTETTGLDPERGELLEVALAVTDDDLVEVAATATVVQPIAPLGVSAWVEHLDPIIREMHGKSGLFDDITVARGVSLREAEAHISTWVGVVACDQKFALSKTQLAGSTVGFDRAWLRRHMPALESLFHYRSIDVSSLTELAARWAPAVYEGRPKAASAHRALADVRESIAYLRYYRECGFVGGSR